MAEKEYISKDYALYLVNYFGNMLTWSKEDIISEIKRKITEDTAADVEPVKHGHWIDNNSVFECSNCNYQFEHEGYKHFFNYCPNCGAKMDGGDENDH